MVARHLLLHGTVQGVFYRAWTVETARELGLHGWVRNLPEGTVEAHVEGELHAVKRLIEAMGEGPTRAHVERIDCREVDCKGFTSFERR